MTARAKRPMGVFKKSNEYARDAMARLDAPKTVWAALALSLAMRCSDDDFDAAHALLADEWRILHQNGIVPQRPKVVR